MRKIYEKDLEKLARIADLPLVDIQKIHALGIIDETKALDRMIKYDYRRAKATGRYTVKQIVMALVDKYGVSHSRITSAMYDKKKTDALCVECGCVTRKSELKRNNGLCDRCVAKKITLNF